MGILRASNNFQLWHRVCILTGAARPQFVKFERTMIMNWDQIQGKWKQMKGSVRQQWGSLTDNDLEMIAGNRDKLVGKLQERYGFVKEEAQKRADDFIKNLNEPAHSQTQPPPPSAREHGSREHATRR